ncbi:hypothetical protein [Planococcus halocryophilus]|uniref:hypothetical protein n=1 Tax=Planococcus halocryophilus TaxID=1215089 RepID=UPI003D33D200
MCNNTEKLEVDHRLPQSMCKPNTASSDENAWILCKGCNISKGARILIEVIREVPRDILGPMLSLEYAQPIAQKRFTKGTITIGNKQYSDVRIS